VRFFLLYQIFTLFNKRFYSQIQCGCRYISRCCGANMMWPRTRSSPQEEDDRRSEGYKLLNPSPSPFTTSPTRIASTIILISILPSMMPLMLEKFCLIRWSVTRSLGKNCMCGIFFTPPGQLYRSDFCDPAYLSCLLLPLWAFAIWRWESSSLFAVCELTAFTGGAHINVPAGSWINRTVEFRLCWRFVLLHLLSEYLAIQIYWISMTKFTLGESVQDRGQKLSTYGCGHFFCHR